MSEGGRATSQAVPRRRRRRGAILQAAELRFARFGFFPTRLEDIAEDVFVHSRVLNDCGFHSLIQGQKLLIDVDDAGKGPQVQAVRLLNE